MDLAPHGEGTGMGFLIRLVVNAAALFLIAYVPLVQGIHVSGFGGALIAALILGIVNAILRPILVILSLPLEIVTLGLFTLVINALLFWLVGALHVGLTVDGFWPAFWGALVMAIISWILSLLTRGLEGRRA
jgi:putative membrane protein